MMKKGGGMQSTLVITRHDVMITCFKRVHNVESIVFLGN